MSAINMIIAVGIVGGLLVFLLSYFGCARVKVTKLEGEYKNGVSFYRPDPYLLVTRNKDGTTQATLIWLPNYKHGYVIKNKGFWGSSKMEVTLENGWNLTKLGTASDSKGPETITAINGALSVAATDQTMAETFDPGLYRFLFDTATDSGHVTTLEKVKIQP